MSCKKKQSGVCVHPLVAFTVLGFAAVGMWGMYCAVKKKACKLKKTVSDLGCDCVEAVCEKAEDLMDEGIHAAERLTAKTN